MTTDVIALCRTRPEGEAQVAALQAAGPDFQVASWQDTPVILLLDENERVVLAVDGARLLQVPGEVRRLLGPSAPEVGEAVWWVEIRASSAYDGAAAAARRLASTLVEHHGGAVWPSEAFG